MTSMEEDFEVFVTHVRPQLTRALTGHVPRADVGDAVADALAYAWEHRARVLAMERPAGYLYRVAQSKARRRKQGLMPWTSDDALPHVEPGLPAALAALSPSQAEAVWLVHGAGMSQVEAAEAMDISPSTIANHVQRGMARLREHLGVEQ